MKRYTLTLVAPMKLEGLKDEIEGIKSNQQEQVFLKVEKEIYELNQLDSALKDRISSNYLLVFESIVKDRINTEKAQEELLKFLKTIKFSDNEVKIVVVIQSEKEKDLVFINELIKLDIQDFFFVNDFNRQNIAAWLFDHSRTLKDNLKYLSTNINKTEIIVKEIPTYVEVPVEKDEKVKERFLFCKKKENVNEATTFNARNPTTIIGVTGVERGSGATTLCVELGRYLKKIGSVAILDKTDRNELVGILKDDIDIFSDGLSKIEINLYDYILIDFGVFFDIGKLSGMTTILSSKEDNLIVEQKNAIDRGYCRKIICICPSALWKLYKADFLINNPVCEKDTEQWIFLFNGNSDTKQFKANNFELKRKIITTHNNPDYLQEIEMLI